MCFTCLIIVGTLLLFKLLNFKRVAMHLLLVSLSDDLGCFKFVSFLFLFFFCILPSSLSFLLEAFFFFVEDILIILFLVRITILDFLFLILCKPSVCFFAFCLFKLLPLFLLFLSFPDRCSSLFIDCLSFRRISLSFWRADSSFWCKFTSFRWFSLFTL